MYKRLVAWPLLGKQLAVAMLDLALALLATWLAFSLRLDTPHWPTGLQWRVYLLAPGTEVIGAQLVSLWQGGAIDVVAALSLINVVLVGIGLAIALRFGVKLRD